MSNPVIDQISNRVSVPRLGKPAPAPELLAQVYQCALRAPDHMMLRPWRYLVVEGNARKRLGELFCESAKRSEGTLSEAQEDKYRAMPMRAPMLVVAISTNQSHPKVPVLEQQLSCGVGVGYMLLALQSMGFGGMWRTGPLAENEHLKEALGVAANETIIGFLYLGTPKGETKMVPQLELDDYFQIWQPESSKN